MEKCGLLLADVLSIISKIFKKIFRPTTALKLKKSFFFKMSFGRFKIEAYKEIAVG